MLRYVLLVLTLISGFSAIANPRYSDPDGCLSCHAYEGLSYIDENGVMRSSTISRSHYASSLHGSIPCKDCHREVVDYPHKVENTEVDCSESCHIEEPSEGVKYTHNPIHEEMDESVHAGGWFKGLTGGNRLEEIETEQDPSCRRCHSNTLYIATTQLEKFKTDFDHAETECGNCHQGQAWMGQFGGHILRRLVGRRWNNQENNQMCIDCHADNKKMRDVEQEDPDTKEKHPPSERFIHSADSYAKTLHGRLLVDGSAYGASCIDCHAPAGWKHEIRSYLDLESTSHPDNLPETCGQSNCHGYAKQPGNEGFTMTDMHAVSLVALQKVDRPLQIEDLLKSNWFWSSWPLMSIGIIFAIGSLVWWLLYRNVKKILAIVGGDRFERVMIGRKPRAARKKSAAKAKVRQSAKPAATERSKTEAENKSQPSVTPAATTEANNVVDTELNKPDSVNANKQGTDTVQPDNNPENKGD